MAWVSHGQAMTRPRHAMLLSVGDARCRPSPWARSSERPIQCRCRFQSAPPPPSLRAPPLHESPPAGAPPPPPPSLSAPGLPTLPRRVPLAGVPPIVCHATPRNATLCQAPTSAVVAMCLLTLVIAAPMCINKLVFQAGAARAGAGAARAGAGAASAGTRGPGSLGLPGHAPPPWHARCGLLSSTAAPPCPPCRHHPIPACAATTRPKPRRRPSPPPTHRNHANYAPPSCSSLHLLSQAVTSFAVVGLHAAYAIPVVCK